MSDDLAMRRTHDLRWADLAIALAMALFLALVLEEEADPDLAPLPLALGYVLAVVQGLALWWRRRHPELVAAVVLAGALGLQLLCPEVIPAFAGFVAVWTLTLERPTPVSAWGLAGLVLVSLTGFSTGKVLDTLFVVSLSVLAWALAELVRTHRGRREQQAQLLVEQEQARIARELHDVIAHNLSVIVVQAGAADEVFDAAPDQARGALRSIESSGREALAELRRLLGVIRPLDDAYRPAPGLERLDELVEPLRAAGLAVAIRREGEAYQLPPGVDLSAYRIVQEALTNTLRHARATEAEVAVRYGRDALELEVRDNGRGMDGVAASSGHGIVGMRERAALVGGSLDVGAASRGGVRVRARLPLEARG